MKEQNIMEYRGVQVPEIEAVEPEEDGHGSGSDSGT
jgi:hypothetical protein